MGGNKGRMRQLEAKHHKEQRPGRPNNSAMGRVYLEHFGGEKLFSCAQCDTFLTNRKQLISTRFTGATGRAYLFNRVVNLNYSEPSERIMLTGRHWVRDVSCKRCHYKLGWMYELAAEDEQTYNEGKVILEKALYAKETDCQSWKLWNELDI